MRFGQEHNDFRAFIMARLHEHGDNGPHSEGHGEHHVPGPEGFGAHFRRGGGGPGPEGGFWGRRGGGGPGPEGRRRGAPMFGRGDLKYGLLDLLRDKPKHGYELIKDLEARSGGFYTPSAGAIYPTLQMMEDLGWVTSQTVEGKKVYTITALGTQTVQERAVPETEEPHHGPPHEHDHERHQGPRLGPQGPQPFGPRFWGREVPPAMRDLFGEGRELVQLMRAAVRVSQEDPAKLARLQAVIAQTRDALIMFLNDNGAPMPAAPQEPEQPQPQAPTPDDLI